MAVKSKGSASRAVVWVILVLLIVGLAGFGATSFGGNVRSIGRVGDTPIDVARYGRAINDELRALQAQTGQPISFAQAQQFGIDRAVLRRLIETVALEDEAARVGLSVGDARVGDYLRDIPAFQGLDGNFDRQGYAFALEQSGLSASEFEEQLRAEIARTLIAGAVSAGTPAPQAYVDTIIRFVGEQRALSYVVLGPEDLASPLPEPTQSDLVAQYESTPEAYTLPEIRQITYAWVTPDRMLDRIEVSDEALRALYEDRIDDYVVPERRLVERLIYPGIAEAEAAKARLDSGEASFEDLVAARGLELADVDLGDVTRADLRGAGDAVFALTEPGVAGPVDTSLGPALFRMNAILSARETPFEEARDALRAEYALDNARRAILDEIETVDDLLAAGATLEELGDETILDTATIDWSETTTGGIAGYEAFRAAAASVQEGDFPEVLELEDGGLFALRLDAVRAPELQPLDAVRAEVAADWRLAQTTRALAEQARALADRIGAGESWADLGLTPQSETGLTRESFVPGVPSAFLQTLFTLAPEATAVVEGPDSVAVMQLDSVAPPDESDPDLAARRAAFEARTAQGLGQDLLTAYTAAVQNEAGIELDQAAINALHAQFQ